MSRTRRIASQHIYNLFRLAREVINDDPELSQRYVRIARKIAMRTKLRLPREYRNYVCRNCKSFIPPGVSCRIRTQSRREPHIVVTCLNCGKQLRIPIRGKKRR